VNEDYLQKVLFKPWAPDGRNFSDRIWENKEKLVNTLHKELTQSIMTGADPQKAIDAIAHDMNVSKANAGRLVMTESAYFGSLAHKDCFIKLGVEEYEIVATLDDKTSEICQEMDGKHFPTKDFEPGVTADPFHVNCRSTTCPYFNDEFSLGERAARDENGEVYYVSSDMTYSEWKEAFVDGGSKEELKKNIELPKNLTDDKGLSEDIKAEIKNTIDSLKAEYDLNLDEIVYGDIPGEGNAPMQFNPVNIGGRFKAQLVINKNFDWNENLDALNARVYTKNYLPNKLTSRNLKNLVQHEMAHFMTFQDCNTWESFIEKERLVRNSFVPGLSLYNEMSRDGAETIAEGFVVWSNGAPLPTEILNLVEKYVLRWKK